MLICVLKKVYFLHKQITNLCTTCSFVHRKCSIPHKILISVHKMLVCAHDEMLFVHLKDYYVCTKCSSVPKIIIIRELFVIVMFRTV